MKPYIQIGANVGNDALNITYRTGIGFLNEFVIPKFKNYRYEDIILGGMPTYKFTKI